MRNLTSAAGVLEWAEDFSHRSPHWQSPGSIETAAYLARAVRVLKYLEQGAFKDLLEDIDYFYAEGEDK